MLHNKLILSNNKNTFKPAIFCDRDGVLIDDLHYISDPEKVFLLEGAKNLLNIAKSLEFYFIVITNQSGIHRGLLSWQEYEAVTYKMLDLLENNAHISAIYANACSPNSEDSWRKPNTGMINEAAKDFNIDIKKSILIGDRLTDLIAGAKVSCAKLIHVKTGHGAKETKMIKKYFMEHNFDKECKLISINNISEINANLLLGDNY